MRMNGRTKGGRERKNGWKGNIAIVDEREVDVWLPSMPVSLACLSSMSDRCSGLLPPFRRPIASDRLERRSGSDIEENNQGSLSVRPAARGRHQGRADEGLELPALMSYLVVPRAGYCRHPGARPLHILFLCLGMVLSTSKRDDGGARAHQRGKLAVFSRCNAICIVCAPFRVGMIP